MIRENREVFSPLKFVAIRYIILNVHMADNYSCWNIHHFSLLLCVSSIYINIFRI